MKLLWSRCYVVNGFSNHFIGNWITLLPQSGGIVSHWTPISSFKYFIFENKFMGRVYLENPSYRSCVCVRVCLPLKNSRIVKQKHFLVWNLFSLLFQKGKWWQLDETIQEEWVKKHSQISQRFKKKKKQSLDSIG